MPTLAETQMAVARLDERCSQQQRQIDELSRRAVSKTEFNARFTPMERLFWSIIGTLSLTIVSGAIGATLVFGPGAG